MLTFRNLLQLRALGLSRNAAFAGAQACVGLVSTFWAYRVFVQHVGLEQAGIWSLMFAGISVARLADVSGAGGLARFVASARQRSEDPVPYVHTVTLCILAMYGTVALLIIPAAYFGVGAFFTGEGAKEAKSLLPLVMVLGLFLMPIASALASAIDGLHRADQRSVITMSASVLFVPCAVIGVRLFGLMGWAFAQVAQQAFLVLASWALLRRRMPGLGFFPLRWSKTVFSETIHYGLKLQANSLASLLSDPLARFLIAHFGGLSAAGLFDVATKLVLSIRSIIVQMVVPIVPEFAALQNGAGVSSLLTKASRWLSASAVLFLIVTIAVSPLYSLLMLKSVRMDLVLVLSALAIGHSINIAAVPFYFAGVALNHMRWNIVSQFSMAACIALLGGLLGTLMGPTGVVLSVMLGLITGALFVIVGAKRTIVPDCARVAVDG